MTDAETLTLAFFRQEFQMTPRAAKVLLALYQRRSPISLADLAARFSVKTQTMSVYFVMLRNSIGADCLRHEEGAYRLSEPRRAEIGAILSSAVNQLAAA